MGDKFEIELKNGEKKEATLITRINTENTKNEYIYYFIKNTDNNNVSINASICSRILLSSSFPFSRTSSSESYNCTKISDLSFDNFVTSMILTS